MNQSIDNISKLNEIIDKITFYQIRVTFRAESYLVLPEYKGSAFRGCMGDAFRRLVCQYPGKKCEGCALEHHCAFSYMYASRLAPTHHLNGKYSHPPRPYIILPMIGSQTNFEKDELFWFDLLLVGNAIQLFPILNEVFNKMGEVGIGRYNSTFKVDRIETFQSESNNFKVLQAGEFPEELSLSRLTVPEMGMKNKITLDFENPVRFIKDKKPLGEPPKLNLLINHLAKRLTMLSHLYCDAEWFDTDRVFDIEDSISIDCNNLKWVDWSRYSGTKEMNMHFDGFAGTITYVGEITPWLKLLQAGTWLSTGATATFGLGKFSILNNA